MPPEGIEQSSVSAQNVAHQFGHSPPTNQQYATDSYFLQDVKDQSQSMHHSTLSGNFHSNMGASEIDSKDYYRHVAPVAPSQVELSQADPRYAALHGTGDTFTASNDNQYFLSHVSLTFFVVIDEIIAIFKLSF